EVIFDRFRAEVESCRRLTRRGAISERERNLELLRRELLPVAIVAHARGLAARLQLGHRTLSPRRCAQLVERLERRAQVLARLDARSTAAPRLAEVKLGARPFEGVRCRFVMT